MDAFHCRYSLWNRPAGYFPVIHVGLHVLLDDVLTDIVVAFLLGDYENQGSLTPLLIGDSDGGGLAHVGKL